MFEALAMVCLESTCHEVLAPGYEAATLAECEAALIARMPEGITAARCAVSGPALEVEEVAPGVFAHIGAIEEPDPRNGGDVANLGFVVGDQSVAVIDAGTTRHVAEGLWRAIRQHTDLPVSHLILTHMHPDHVLGAPLFADAGAQVIGHENLPRALADRQEGYLLRLGQEIGAAGFEGSGIAPVDQGITGPVTVDLGGRSLTLTPWPLAHTGTDVTVQDSVSGVFFAGDLLFEQHCPSLDGSVKGWRAVLDQLQQITASAVVPGHGRVLRPWPQEVAIASYLEALQTETRAALDQGLRLSDAVAIVAQEASSHWDLCSTYTPRNVTITYTELEWD